MTAIEGEDCLSTPVVVPSLYKRKVDFEKENKRVSFIHKMLIHH